MFLETLNPKPINKVTILRITCRDNSHALLIVFTKSHEPPSSLTRVLVKGPVYPHNGTSVPTDNDNPVPPPPPYWNPTPDAQTTGRI